ncbi:MAG: hypothetical protein H0U24_07945, partial [Thermoleophilaceae bacterium]|nr:hypothetical protein [Thermoleophilaceae bacterium]
TSTDPVAKASRSPDAQLNAQTKRTADGAPCHSYKSLLTELATQARCTTRVPAAKATFDKLTEPTPLQAHAHQLAADAPVTA